VVAAWGLALVMTIPLVWDAGAADEANLREPPIEAAPSVVNAARELLGAVLEAYRSAPVIVDEVDEIVSVPGEQPKENHAEVILGPNRAMHVVAPPDEFAAFDGYLRMKSTRNTRSYILEAQGPREDNARLGFGRSFHLHLVLRSSRSLASIMRDLALEIPGEYVTITNLRRITDEQGRDLHEVTLASSEGFTRLRIDDSTKLIVGATSVSHERGSSQDVRSRREITCHPRALDELPSPMTFDPEGRKPLDWGCAGPEYPLLQRLEVGDPSPSFTLRTMPGKVTVVAPGSNGRVVILAFWSTGLQTSRRDAQKMMQLVKWAAEQDPAIEVHIINAREERFDKTERWGEVADFLDENGVEHPVLFDEDNEVADAFDIYAPPAVVVIGPDGIVRGVYGGLGEDKIDVVRNLATSLK